ncbi:endonuclease/exonuclease/phosphatase family protein [Microvirga pudoricolor]|uniref:endonuclease/exonuclease/phosphatase family protein n=1 Tax=Microvirga pudoricolor TaxID=2778729 RepID=UPI00194E7798|nr:endonuclease/exonuclease/phosphatase family protein [Microvirga pudoricolor]MBM6593215.1 endonuclease/exonuclease/phosphatase family protein [Microvirga pudoricolor]
MKLLTWNIQWGLGCDGRLDLARIARTAREWCDADVFCFQEVSANFEALDGGENQPRVLADLFPDYRPIFRPAVELGDRDGRSRVFGNMILSRLPVLQVTSHMLPWPAEEGRSMQRQALEAVVASNLGAVRIMTCHLEYHFETHRQAQVARILELNEEAQQRSRLSYRDPSDGPYRDQDRPVGTVLCGDFNLGPDDPLYEAILTRRSPGQQSFVDAWRVVHGQRPHEPTVGIADAKQWPQGPHCRDYVFVTEDLAPRIRSVRVNGVTTASDHQPIAVELT